MLSLEKKLMEMKTLKKVIYIVEKALDFNNRQN